MADKQADFGGEINPARGPGRGDYYETFSPVTVKETTGTVFLGILAIMLLVALLRSLARNRELAVRLAQGHPKEDS